MEMKNRDLVRKSMQILSEHYQNKDHLLQSCCTKEFIWLESPLHHNLEKDEQQEEISGREERSESRDIPVFGFPRDICLLTCRESDAVSVIILQYCTDVWRIRCHISTLTQQMQLTWIRSPETVPHSDDAWKLLLVSETVLPDSCCINALSEKTGLSVRKEKVPAFSSKPLFVRDSGNYYSRNPRFLQIHMHEQGIRILDLSTIIWIESDGIHSRIHTPLETIEATESVHVLEERTKGYLIRPHSSYLINPAFIISIRRFEIELTDGAHIPVPQRKYTRIRNLLTEKIIDCHAAFLS